MFTLNLPYLLLIDFIQALLDSSSLAGSMLMRRLLSSEDLSPFVRAVAGICLWENQDIKGRFENRNISEGGRKWGNHNSGYATLGQDDQVDDGCGGDDDWGKPKGEKSKDLQRVWKRGNDDLHNEPHWGETPHRSLPPLWHLWKSVCNKECNTEPQD